MEIPQGLSLFLPPSNQPTLSKRSCRVETSLNSSASLGKSLQLLRICLIAYVTKLSFRQYFSFSPARAAINSPSYLYPVKTSCSNNPTAKGNTSATKISCLTARHRSSTLNVSKGVSRIEMYQSVKDDGLSSAFQADEVFLSNSWNVIYQLHQRLPQYISQHPRPSGVMPAQLGLLLLSNSLHDFATVEDYHSSPSGGRSSHLHALEPGTKGDRTKGDRFIFWTSRQINPSPFLKRPSTRRHTHPQAGCW